MKQILWFKENKNEKICNKMKWKLMKKKKKYDKEILKRSRKKAKKRNSEIKRNLLKCILCSAIKGDIRITK